MERMSLLLGFLFCSFYTLKSQVHQLPELSIPVSEIRSAIGIDKKGDFALVYKGDTLASHVSAEGGSKATLFDEEISMRNYEDSIEFKYVLPYSYGSYRITLPDSVLIYTKEIRFYGDTIERMVRYEVDGSEKYRLERKGSNKTITTTSDNFKTVIDVSNTGWIRKYQQFQPDSSYYASYSLDSMLLRSSFSNDHINGEKIKGSTNELSGTSDLSRDYRDQDSSYYYTYYKMSDGESRLTEEFRMKYPDYAYECKEWSYIQDFGFEQRYTKEGWDSAYGYQSFGTGSFFSSYENDSLKVSKSFDLHGNIIYRQRIEKIRGRYVLEEEMSKEDTFYHFINYYHLLEWENDTDEITYYYPFKNRVFLNEDSAKIKEYKYDFRKKYEWPEVSIIEGDSVTQIVATAEGRLEYGSPMIFICGNQTPYVEKIQKIDHSTVKFQGALRKSSKSNVLSFVEGCKVLELGMGWPPVYFVRVERHSILSSMQTITKGCKDSLSSLLNQKDDVRTKLYYNGKTHKVMCSFLKMDYKLKMVEIQ